MKELLLSFGLGMGLSIACYVALRDCYLDKYKEEIEGICVLLFIAFSLIFIAIFI